MPIKFMSSCGFCVFASGLSFLYGIDIKENYKTARSFTDIDLIFRNRYAVYA